MLENGELTCEAITWSWASLKWIRRKSKNKEQIQPHDTANSWCRKLFCSVKRCLPIQTSKRGWKLFAIITHFCNLEHCSLRGFWEDLKLNKITHVETLQIKSYLFSSFFSSEREGGWGWSGGREMEEGNRENRRRKKDGQEEAADCGRPSGATGERPRVGNARAGRRGQRISLSCPLPCAGSFLFSSAPARLSSCAKREGARRCPGAVNTGLEPPQEGRSRVTVLSGLGAQATSCNHISGLLVTRSLCFIALDVDTFWCKCPILASGQLGVRKKASQ